MTAGIYIMKEKLRQARVYGIVLFAASIIFVDFAKADGSVFPETPSDICSEFDKTSNKASFSCLISLVDNLRNIAEFCVKTSGPGSLPAFEFDGHLMLKGAMTNVKKVLIQIMVTDKYEPSDVEKEKLGLVILETLRSFSVMYDQDIDNAPIEELFFLGVYTGIHGKPLSALENLFRKPKVLAAANLSIIRNKISESKKHKDRIGQIDKISDLKIEIINAFSYCVRPSFFLLEKIDHLDLYKYDKKNEHGQDVIEDEMNFIIEKIAPNFVKFCNLNLPGK